MFRHSNVQFLLILRNVFIRWPEDGSMPKHVAFIIKTQYNHNTCYTNFLLLDGKLYKTFELAFDVFSGLDISVEAGYLTLQGTDCT
jgi:hypothetical protein